MKYKIESQEVEAIQYTGKNFQEICKFMGDYSSPIPSIESNGHYPNIELTIRLGSSVSDISIGHYIIISKNYVFNLSEQDFNNMVIKTKEPKFKVGDIVYYIGIDGTKFDCDLVTISKVNETSYDLYDKHHHVTEQELFTLEEAIEKLKQL